jgi:ectoine hydroxylase-related dioxygenase (phytanoyl-CoA dioxygenase family)
MFNKSGDVNWLVVWHQDTALPLAKRFQLKGWGPWSKKAGVAYAHAPTEGLSKVVALRVHLDDSTPDNGPLRVIPGSHKLGVLSEDQILKHAKVNSPVECIASKGSVMAMRPLLIHASSKALNNQPRRVLHIEYIASLDIAKGIRLALA